MGEASRDSVGGTSHESQLKLGVEKGWAQGSNMSCHSGGLEICLLL